MEGYRLKRLHVLLSASNQGSFEKHCERLEPPSGVTHFAGKGTNRGAAGRKVCFGVPCFSESLSSQLSFERASILLPKQTPQACIGLGVLTDAANTFKRLVRAPRNCETVSPNSRPPSLRIRRARTRLANGRKNESYW